MKNQGAYHLMLSVSNGKVSKEFYNQLFNKLQWERVYEDKESAGYSDGHFTLWIVPAENTQSETHHFKSVGFHHFSIRVPKKEIVDTMHEWCIQNKITIADAPKHYPQYSEDYYALFFLDPDGMKLEITYL